MRLSEKEVYRRLREHIASVHGTQTNFAKAAGVSSAYVSAVLRGKSKIPADWLGKINVCREVTVSYHGAFE